ncbi:hypothetical protein [Endomicrobium proavitum]|uniref:Acetyltransferase n=1 Tax=Endomicrobium proavitum TaxID=1408281 RepID=A0A0G3WKT2_9BACT|nr:hypothetical protein [Endomicrobium proavitum]AKL98475.1 acetyltransferase [Endomicrobium proavitum]
MRILIDTNILINLEDDKIIGHSFSNFYKLAQENKCDVIYNQAAVSRDIENDKDEIRKEKILSKIKKYPTQQNPAIPPETFITVIGQNNPHDEIDNIQIYQVYCKYVDIFVTEDRGIHKKAKKLNISAKVLNIEEATAYIKQLFIQIVPAHPVINSGSVRELTSYLQFDFFNKLREDYNNFNQWFNKCCEEDRHCYYYVSGQRLGALLIYNIENTDQHQIPNIYSNVLKICTLKVGDNVLGFKFGELFLNKIFEYCIYNKIKYVYVTVYKKHTKLIELLEAFGFNKNKFINNQNVEELRMIKIMDKLKITERCNLATAHPFYLDKKEIPKYVIPIQKNFYNRLFKDGKLRQNELFDRDVKNIINEVSGNGIKKVYVSNQKRTNIEKGALLLFYVSQYDMLIEPLGILDNYFISNDIKEIKQVVRKKSVYSDYEIEKWLSEREKVSIIEFRLVYYLERGIPYRELFKLESFKNKIQTITKIQEDDYNKLKQKGYFNGNYIID